MFHRHTNCVSQKQNNISHQNRTLFAPNHVPLSMTSELCFAETRILLNGNASLVAQISKVVVFDLTVTKTICLTNTRKHFRTNTESLSPTHEFSLAKTLSLFHRNTNIVSQKHNNLSHQNTNSFAPNHAPLAWQREFGLAKTRLLCCDAVDTHTHTQRASCVFFGLERTATNLAAQHAGPNDTLWH